MLVWFKKTPPLGGINNSKLELNLSIVGAPLTPRRYDQPYTGGSIGGHSPISAMISSNTELCSLTGE